MATGYGQRQTAQQRIIQGKVSNQPDYPIAADMRVFHDGQNPFPTGSSAKSVEEIGQSVFMQTAGYQEAGQDCQQDGYCVRQNKG